MEGRRLTKRQVRISKPNLYHEPSDRLESPFLGSEGPKSKEQPRETDGRNAHKKYEFDCHSTESATCIGVVGKSNVKGRQNIQNHNIIRDHEERKPEQEL